MNCWKVKIKTTSPISNTGYMSTKAGQKGDRYIPCEDGYIYVFCGPPSDIEKVVKADTVLSIEFLGIAYIAE